MIITCENCWWKDQASPCPSSQTNPKCVFYVKPSLRDNKKEEPAKKGSTKDPNDNNTAYKKGDLPL